MIKTLILNYSEHMTDLDLVLKLNIENDCIVYSLDKMFCEGKNGNLDKEEAKYIIDLLAKLNVSTWKEKYEPIFCSINSYEWSLIINDSLNYNGYNAAPKEFKYIKDIIKYIEE